MKLLTPLQVHEEKVQELGLDPKLLDLTSTEAIAAALRRAAAFLCPCSATALVASVQQTLEGLADNGEALRDMIEETLEALVEYGDLLECRDVVTETNDEPATLLYAAPPSFVPRSSGAVLMLGITPDTRPVLSDELEHHVEYTNHVRRLYLTGEDPTTQLLQLGFVELSFEAWLRAPAAGSPSDHLARLNRALQTAPRSTEIEGLTLLDPASPVRFYKGRWIQPDRHNGNFVCRRPQRYGADLWCYVEMENGRPIRLLDLPLSGSRFRGCDEAWHLQAAIDAVRGEPQLFRVRRVAEKRTIVDFFSPVPLWARRRWDAIGAPALKLNCLFSYSFSELEADEELHFMMNRLWLKEMTGQPAR